jgi:hypothetical protein
MLRRFEDQHAGPFPEDCPAPPYIERTAGWVAIPRRGQDPGEAEAVDHITLQRTLGPAGDGHIEKSRSNFLERLSDGVGRRHTGRRQVEHRAPQSVALGERHPATSRQEPKDARGSEPPLVCCAERTNRRQRVRERAQARALNQSATVEIDSLESGIGPGLLRGSKEEGGAPVQPATAILGWIRCPPGRETIEIG